ncbi:MAG TPA: EF-P lysine aminoacylase EpmA [Methylomirabilota bacterium]|nr:EF-P lysine aminoacylase EpmA [Methylomirabilota bacterium]
MRRTWWHPAEYARRRPYLLARNRMTAAIRAFFAGRGFIEVETPALQVSPGMEPHLHAFATDLEAEDGRRRRRLYLHTSPEFACKKLLAAGEPRLFTLARVWRNRERSARHAPEFTLLEWYRSPGDYRELIEDCRQLLREVAQALGIKAYRQGDQACDPFADWEDVTVVDACGSFAGIDLLASLDDPVNPDRERLAKAATSAGVRVAADDSWSDIFTKIMVTFVEPQLGRAVPTVLRDYPVPEAALARRKPGEPRLAERFELYVAGLELANAFGELTDAVEQRARFEADQDLKQRLYGERYPIDEQLLQALPLIQSAAGIALGVDRLAMLATGASSIDDVLWAAVARVDG